jgi:hypothetical protein
MDFPRAQFHAVAVFMSAHKLMKAVFGKANRSGFHYFLTSSLPVRRAPEAGFDVLGVVMVVSLSAGVVLLMRLILINWGIRRLPGRCSLKEFVEKTFAGFDYVSKPNGQNAVSVLHAEMFLQESWTTTFEHRK